jgi:protein-disulfide isomerase
MNIIRVIHACFVILVASDLYAQGTPICKQMDEVLTELRQIRKLLESNPNRPGAVPDAAPARIEVGDAPFLGSKDAPFTIVEFIDYQCSYCQQFFKSTFQDLKKLFIDTGKVRFYSMDFPLVDMHPAALLGAQAARCANDQGSFWAMHDKMQAAGLEVDKLAGYVQELGMNVAVFRHCLDTGKYKDVIQAQMQNLATKGVHGTPSFVVGKSTEYGVDGTLIIGTLPFGIFQQKLRSSGLSD